MVNKRQKMKKNNNNKRVARTRQQPMLRASTNVVVPRGYPPLRDAVELKLRTKWPVKNTSSGGVTSWLIALDPGSITTTQYVGLGDIFVPLIAFQETYSRWMVKRMRVETQMVTAATSAGYTAFNYEPTNSTVASPPTTLANVVNSIHHGLATPTIKDGYEVEVSSYYNDWRNTQPVGATGSQCGVVQIVGSNTLGDGSTVALMDIEIDVVFAGYK